MLKLQDAVTEKIVAALSVNLTAEEQLHDTSTRILNPQARDAFLRGLAHYRRNTPDDYAKAIVYLKEAVKLEPKYPRAYAVLAAVYWDSRSRGLESSGAY